MGVAHVHKHHHALAVPYSRSNPTHRSTYGPRGRTSDAKPYLPHPSDAKPDASWRDCREHQVGPTPLRSKLSAHVSESTTHPRDMRPAPPDTKPSRLVPARLSRGCPSGPHGAARALGRPLRPPHAATGPSHGVLGLQARGHGPLEADLQRARSHHPSGASRRSAARSACTLGESSSHVD